MGSHNVTDTRERALRNHSQKDWYLIYLPRGMEG